MRFDEDSQLDTSQVQDTRGRGGFSGFPRGGGVAIGGGAGRLGVIVCILLLLLGGGPPGSGVLRDFHRNFSAGDKTHSRYAFTQFTYPLQ